MDVLKVENKQQLEDAFEVRRKVFIDEQHVPEEEEIDQYEDDAVHFVLYDGTAPIAAGRLRTFDETAKVERICVMASHRKTGAGKKIMERIEAEARELGCTKATLGAQTHAENFYGKLGYKTVSGIFMDAGIPHVTMEKQL